MIFRILFMISEKLKDIKFLVLVPIAIIVLYTLVSFLIIHPYSNNLVRIEDESLKEDLGSTQVAIVFGGGVGDDGPLPLLKERLDTAKELLDKGYVKLLILSGDNRTEMYNEPTAMYNYLLKQGVSSQQMQEDFAGRSTYETCERAKKVFGLDSAVLITEETHLPRARYLCDHFGIRTVGLISEGSATSGLMIGQNWREILARNKAILNIYIMGEKTILGDNINLNL